MPVKHYHPIDLLQNELRNASIHTLSSNPPSPKVGQVWRLASDGYLRYCRSAAPLVIITLDNSGGGGGSGASMGGFGGTYSPEIEYPAGIIVIYAGAHWGTSTGTHAGEAPSKTGGPWTFLGDIESAAFEGAWQSDVLYPAGAIVTHAGSSWGTSVDAPLGVAPGTPPNPGTYPTVLPIGTDNIENAPRIYANNQASLASPTFSNSAFTTEPSETSAPNRSAWWVYTPIQSGSMQFTTNGSSGDTVMALYQADTLPVTVANLTHLAYDDDAGAGAASAITRTVTAGVTYYIQVGAYGSGSIMDYCLTLYTPLKTDADRAGVVDSTWVQIGGGGAMGYRHVQDTPSATWVITHGLAFRPNVEVVANVSGSGLVNVFADVSWPSDTQVQVVLAKALTGECYLS